MGMTEEDKQDDRIIRTLEQTSTDQRRNDKQYDRHSTHKYKKKQKNKRKTIKQTKTKKLQIDYHKKKIPLRETNL
jgi:hypothetical protein